MKFPGQLHLLWAERGKSPGWWKTNYEAAVERIEDHTDDPENPYWYAEADESSAVPDKGKGVIIGFDGGHETAEEARERAFDLLVLADLLEAGTD